MIWRRGRIAYFELEGSSDLARGTVLTKDTIFRIYSMTKPLTAVALLMLLEDAKIALDDRVDQFIPQFCDLKITGGGALKRPITVLDLMRHTAGFTYGFHNRTAVDQAYRAQKIAETNTEGGLVAMIEQLKELPLEFSPGEAWIYSVSIDIAGYLIQLLSGKSFADFLREKILHPLKMWDTDFYVPAEKAARFAPCYALRQGRLDLFDDCRNSLWLAKPKLESGGGGLVSTADDYMRFCRMLLNKGELEGVRLLSPKTIALMTANHLPNGCDIADLSAGSDLFNESGYRGVGFGLGVAVMLDPVRAGIPGSPGEYGWGGMASTTFFIDPAEDMAVVFMTQVICDTAKRVRLRRDLRTLIYGAMTESLA